MSLVGALGNDPACPAFPDRLLRFPLADHSNCQAGCTCSGDSFPRDIDKPNQCMGEFRETCVQANTDLDCSFNFRGPASGTGICDLGTVDNPLGGRSCQWEVAITRL
ncbi:MAG TPA: hypothetical protein VKN99_21170 [Polyangia bacterium]|nr:hypothetical protein [Polyangia bacterium]